MTITPSQVHTVSTEQHIATEIDSIVVERSTRANVERVACWWEVGRSIHQHPRAQDQLRPLLQEIQQYLDKPVSESSLYKAAQFFAQYDFEEAFQAENLEGAILEALGKDISWRRVTQQLLPGHEEPQTTPKERRSVACKSLQDLSNNKIGGQWTDTDHQALCSYLEEI